MSSIIDEYPTMSIVIEKGKDVWSVGFQDVSISVNSKDISSFFKNIEGTIVQKGIYKVNNKQQVILSSPFKLKKYTYLIYTGCFFHLVMAKSFEVSVKMDLDKLPGNYYLKCVKDGNDDAFKNSDFSM
jgi:hypothetical protein